ncbi:hypothetical protein J7M23_08300 [Candidatus Sumerlaeota bacterium]|nr:hypothetical protein [Candidatus Sumerlaeota bacterium]
MKIRCVNCGAEQDVDTDIEFCKCAYCGSALYIDISGTVRHLLLIPRTQPAQARVIRILTRWFKEKEIPPKIKIKELRYVLLPFWVLKPAGSMDEQLMPASSNIVFLDKKFRMPSGDFEPFEEARVPEEFELVSPDVVLESVSQKESSGISDAGDQTTPLIAEQGVSQTARNSDSQETDITTLAKESRLVHIPFCEVKYTLFGKTYTALIDVNTEQIVADTIPPSASQIISTSLTLTAIGLFLLYFFIGALVPNSLLRVLLIILVSAPAYFVVDKILKIWKL